MKKYRLKQWYPTLPKDWEEGMEVGVGDYRTSFFFPTNNKYTGKGIIIKEVRDNPEFWEEVVEKDYEILSFKFFHLEEPSTLRTNGSYVWSRYEDKFGGPNLKESLDILKENPKHKIYSVKRVSDGEVFTIGDRVEHVADKGKIKKIDKIYFDGNGVLFFYLENGWYVFIGGLSLAKVSIFTTEDGVDIFEGDEFWGIQKKGLKSYNHICTKLFSKLKSDVYFSTEEAAEEYILWNKNNLSLKDVFDVYPLTKKQGGTMTKHALELIGKVRRDEKNI